MRTPENSYAKLLRRPRISTGVTMNDIVVTPFTKRK